MEIIINVLRYKYCIYCLDFADYERGMIIKMKVLIVSDSHGRDNWLEWAIERVKPIDLMIHLGDFEGSEDYIRQIAPCPVQFVSGNNDYFTDVEREKIIHIGKYTAFITHGHRYRVNFETKTLKEEGMASGADIVMFGHTHRPLLDFTGPVTAINPGSITQPRQEGRIPTFVVMEIDREGEAHYTLNYVK